ncbi:MAG: MarR family transcriptional regulator [Deinococcales bacterium]
MIYSLEHYDLGFRWRLSIGISEAKQRYIEEVGMFLEVSGMQRMMGRVLAALWVAEKPQLAAEELAEMLKASRGSISTATRSLEQIGLIERFSRAGERRDYFQARVDAWSQMMEKELHHIIGMRQLAEKGLKVIEQAKPEYKARLEELCDFMQYWEKEFPLVLTRWRERRFSSEGPKE